jgi:hypothetical protein
MSVYYSVQVVAITSDNTQIYLQTQLFSCGLSVYDELYFNWSFRVNILCPV